MDIAIRLPLDGHAADPMGALHDIAPEHGVAHEALQMWARYVEPRHGGPRTSPGFERYRSKEWNLGEYAPAPAPLPVDRQQAQRVEDALRAMALERGHAAALAAVLRWYYYHDARGAGMLPRLLGRALAGTIGALLAALLRDGRARVAVVVR